MREELLDSCHQSRGQEHASWRSLLPGGWGQFWSCHHTLHLPRRCLEFPPSGVIISSCALEGAGKYGITGIQELCSFLLCSNQVQRILDILCDRFPSLPLKLFRVLFLFGFVKTASRLWLELNWRVPSVHMWESGLSSSTKKIRKAASHSAIE